MEFKLSQDYHQSSSKLAKSYTCSFCKRGFLNAQALGGHMNIHRKDRAKLKESSKEVQKTGSSEDETFKAKNDCNHKANEIDCFSETSSQDHGETKNCVNGDSEKNKDLISGLEKPEIDLELRLGLEHI